MRIQFRMKKYFVKYFKKTSSDRSSAECSVSFSISMYSCLRLSDKRNIFCRFVASAIIFKTDNIPMQVQGANWVNSNRFSADIFETRNMNSAIIIMHKHKKKKGYLNLNLKSSYGNPISQRFSFICLKRSSNWGISMMSLVLVYRDTQVLFDWSVVSKLNYCRLNFKFKTWKGGITRVVES